MKVSHGCNHVMLTSLCSGPELFACCVSATTVSISRQRAHSHGAEAVLREAVEEVGSGERLDGGHGGEARQDSEVGHV